MISERQRSLEHRMSTIKTNTQFVEQDVKYLEDLQDEFDFRYKTLQTQEQSDRNNVHMKEEVFRLQGMLNQLDHKRKVYIVRREPISGQTTAEKTGGTAAESDLRGRSDAFAKTSFGGKSEHFDLRLHKKSQVDLKLFLTSVNILEKDDKLSFTSIMFSSFVVERQPCMPTHPQRAMVLKTGVQFTVKLRFLVKLPELNYQLKVKATIDKYRKFNILGTNTKVMNMEESVNGSLSVEFRHLQLKEQKSSAGTKGNEVTFSHILSIIELHLSSQGPLIVTEELHSINFETQFCHQDLIIDLETSSLPVVVISNVSQLPSGWASVIWYNMLMNDPKENLPNRFSFWLWLDGILELIKKHLLTLWIDGYIVGFVSKEKERALLKDKPSGTFLLRFSESSRDGAITFTWVDRSENGEMKFHSVEPYSKSQLLAVPLPDIIRDYKVMVAENIPENPLQYLYPDIQKDKAFGRHYNNKPKEVSEPTVTQKGYISSRFIPFSEFPNASTAPVSSSDLLPMSPGVYAELKQQLSPAEIETAVCFEAMI
ncbi:signal transducer and activator of transcription 4-like [Leucoraja erinacea]|uniref:signal transducer and activator of transcription 4-like n=1 Tax=Leucoraja erinaceus TaxID=7782 RepID=UPI0024573A8B|nr:signal transducer and activator of transcription 4-like [Leucoraja erinacea]